MKPRLLLRPPGFRVSEANRIGFSSRRVSWSIIIDEEGDALVSKRTFDLAPRTASPDVVPLPMKWWCDNGAQLKGEEIEFLDNGPASIQDFKRFSSEEGRDLVLEYPTWKSMARDPDRPVSFATRVWSLGSFALTTRQFQERWGKPKDGAWVERCTIVANHPTPRLDVCIALPRTFALPQEPTLTFESAGPRGVGSAAQETFEAYVAAHYRPGLMWFPENNSFTLGLVDPPLGQYHIRWMLPGEAAVPDQRWLGQAVHFRERLRNPVFGKSIQSAFAILEVSIRKFLGIDVEKEDIDLSLMVEDAGDPPMLVVAAHNGVLGEGVNSFKLHLGSGTAGRAYRNRQMRVYQRNGLKSKKPTPYELFDEQRMHHAVLYSIPIFHPKDPTIVLAVLNVGSRRVDSRLITSESDADLFEAELGARANEDFMEYLSQGLGVGF